MLYWKKQILFFLSYIIVDIFFSIFCLGFYQNSLGFNKKTLEENLFLLNGYNFTSNSIDFVLLAFLRTIILTICLIGALVKVFQRVSIIFLGMFICNSSYSLIKILAFSETEKMMFFYGVWFSICWNVLSFGFLYFSWKHWFKNEYVLISFERLTNLEISHSTTIAKRSTLSHVSLLIKYCFYYYKWLITGKLLNLKFF